MSVRPSPAPTNIITPSSTSSSQQPPSPSVPSPRSITLQQIDYAQRFSKDSGETLDFSRLQLDSVADDALEALATGPAGRRGVKRLALSHNAYSSLPSSVLLLTRLRYLNLKGNEFREVPAVLASLETLEILDISRNKIRRLPEKPGRLTQLRVLSISQNRIRVLPSWFAELEELKVFKAEHNPIEWPPKELTTRPRNPQEDEEKIWIGALRDYIKQHPNGPPPARAPSEPSTSPTKHQQTSPHPSHSLPTSTSVGSTTSSIFATHPHHDSAGHTRPSASSHRRAHSGTDVRLQSISNRQITIPLSPSASNLANSPTTSNNPIDSSTARPRKSAHARSASSISRPPSPPMTDASSSRTPSNSDRTAHIEPLQRPNGSYPSPSPSPIDVPLSRAEIPQSIASPSTPNTLSSDDLTPTTATHSHSSHHHSPSQEPVARSPSESADHIMSSTVSSSARPSRLSQDPASTPRPAPTPSSTNRHSRNASFNAQPQRLSQLLGSKKSLPDLRLPHAQIISERRQVGDARLSGAAVGAGGGGWAAGEAERSTNRSMAGGRIHRKSSEETLALRNAVANSRPFPSNRALLQGLESASSSNPLDFHNRNGIPASTTATDGPQSLYFQRLSTLHPSPVPTSTVLPPPLLAFIHSTRSLLFALSQIHTSLSSHLLLSPHHLHRSTNVLQKVLQPAGVYVGRLVDALDRFDSVSRRKTGGVEGGVVKGVVEASRDAVGVFGKVVAVLSIQLKVSGSSSSTGGGKEKERASEELRFTRTLLLMLYGAMSEISIAWNGMQPLLKSIAPLLHTSSTPTTDSFPQHRQSPSSAAGPSTPGPSRTHHIVSKASLSGASIRTPISPIPERAESQSPSSSMANSPVFKRSVSSGQPFSSLASSASNGSLSGMATAAMTGGGKSGSKEESTSSTAPTASTTPTPGPPSQAARSKSRRHAGSFSTKDVDLGAKMLPTPVAAETVSNPSPSPKAGPSASLGPPALRSALRNPLATSSPSSSGTSAAPLPQHHNASLPSHTSSTTYETSPFSVSEPFPKSRSNTTNPSNNPSCLQIPPPNNTSNSSSRARSPSSSGHSPVAGATASQNVLSRPTHSTRSSVSSVGDRAPLAPSSPPDEHPSSHARPQQQQPPTSSYASNVRNGRYGLSNYGRSGSATGLAEPSSERPSMATGGGGEAASRVLDDGLVELLEEAVQAALAVYPSIEEDASTFLQFVKNQQANSLSESTSSTALRSPPLPTKRTTELLALLPVALSHAHKLKTILSSRSASPPSPSIATGTTPTLSDASQTFLSHLTALATLARFATLEERVEFRRPIKVGLGRLTRLGMDCGTLMHVSTLRGGSGGAGGITRPGTSLSVHQQQARQGDGDAASIVGGRSTSSGGGVRNGMRPLALGTGGGIVAGGNRARTATFGMGGGRVPLGGTIRG